MTEPTEPTPHTPASAPARAPRSKFGAERRAKFLDNLRLLGSFYSAARAAGVHRSTVYDAINADPSFREEYEAAKEDGLDMLEARAHQRAHQSSDNLLIFLLKAGRPEKYRETLGHEITGRGGGPLQVAAAATVTVYIPDNGRDPVPGPESAGDHDDSQEEPTGESTG